MNLKHKLHNPVFKVLHKTAIETGTKAFVVGGFVRDILLKRPNKDIDIVVEGNGIDFAKKVANKLENVRGLSVFKNFGTAMIKLDDYELEFVGARKESYRAESRKPIVEDGSIAEDQERRDFTINAMSISLNDADFGELIDPFDGQKDVVNGINKAMSRKYICVEQPTVVKLPSFLELLQLPPADEKPVVAVYKFTVLIRSTIFLAVYIFLVSQYISVVTFIPIALVVVMIISVFVLSGRENIIEFNNSLNNITDTVNIL